MILQTMMLQVDQPLETMQEGTSKDKGIVGIVWKHVEHSSNHCFGVNRTSPHVYRCIDQHAKCSDRTTDANQHLWLVYKVAPQSRKGKQHSIANAIHLSTGIHIRVVHVGLQARLETTFSIGFGKGKGNIFVFMVLLCTINRTNCQRPN